MSRHEGLLSPWTDSEAGPSRFAMDSDTQQAAGVETSPATDEKAHSSTHADKAKRAQSCDSCRRRKIKCIQIAPDEGSSDGTRQCRACHSLGTKCTYVYIPKRPGPQTSRTGQSKHARNEAKKAPSNSSASNTEDLNRSILESLDVWPTSPSAFPHYAQGSPEEYSDLNTLHTTGPPSFAASFDSFPSTSFVQPSPSPFQAAAAGPVPPFTPSSYPRSLHDVAPRQLFHDIILVYFSHLYPLLPIVHRPTYERDLAARLDEIHADFLAFTLSLAAFTLLDAPESALPIGGDQRRELHRKCHQASRSIRHKTYESAGLVPVATLYLDYLYLAGTNCRTTANAVLAEAISLAYSIGLHVDNNNTDGKGSDASNPASSMNVIERELRRRIFYMLYNSDKTVALLQSRPMMLRDDTSSGVPLPLAIDDEMLFPERAHIGHIPSHPSALDGFVATIKLSKLLSEILETRRGTERCPPAHAKENQEHRSYINVMLKRVKATVEEASKVYRNGPITQSSAFLGGSSGCSGGASMASSGTALALRANIAITWTVIRFALAEYQDLLTIPVTRSTLACALQQQQQQQQSQQSSSSSSASSPKTQGMASSGLASREQQPNEYEMAIAELSDTLQTIPLEYLLINGHRFYSKLLYITSSMFQRCPPGTTSYTHLARLIDLLTQVTLVRNEEEAAEAAAAAAAAQAAATTPSSSMHNINNNNNNHQHHHHHHHYSEWTTATRTNTNNSSMTTPVL